MRVSGGGGAGGEGGEAERSVNGRHTECGVTGNWKPGLVRSRARHGVPTCPGTSHAQGPSSVFVGQKRSDTGISIQLDFHTEQPWKPWKKYPSKMYNAGYLLSPSLAISPPAPAPPPPPLTLVSPSSSSSSSLFFSL